MFCIDMLCQHWLFDIWAENCHCFLTSHFLWLVQCLNSREVSVYVFAYEWRCGPHITPAWPSHLPNKGARQLIRWLVKQSAAWLSTPASGRGDIIESVSTKCTSSLSPPSAYLFGCAVTYSTRALMCYAVSGTHAFSHPFLWLPSSPFSLVVLTYPALQFLDSALEGLSQETGFLFKREMHWHRKPTMLTLPGAGEQIFLPQLLLCPSPCMLCYGIAHSSFKIGMHVSSCIYSAVNSVMTVGHNSCVGSYVGFRIKHTTIYEVTADCSSISDEQCK